MSKQFNKSFVWIWMAALLSASVGVSVQQVYCYCVGKTTVSLFATNEACQAETVAASMQDCCAKKAASRKHSCCEKPESEKKGCTRKSTKVFQLKTEYEVASADFKKLDAGKFLLELPSFPPFSQSALAFQTKNLPQFDRPPPPISGRMLCVRHGVFRC